MDRNEMNLVHRLGECIYMCNMCFDACLKEDDVAMMAGCIRLDKECAAICGAALQNVYGDNWYRKDMLKLCRKVCEDCAEECGKFTQDHCRRCAKACQDCADACAEFI